MLFSPYLLQCIFLDCIITMPSHCSYIPPYISVGNLIQFINTKVGRQEEDELYIYIQNELVAAKDSKMASIYQEYREDDYFLYLAYYERNIYETESKP